MISDTVKHNWVETAAARWDCLYRNKTLPAGHKPSKQLLGGLLNVMFSNERLLANDASYVNLTSVTSENLFSAESRKLILQRLDNSIGKAKAVRKIAFDCLKHAYEEGFDTQVPVQKKTPSAPAKNRNRKPIQKKEAAPKTLSEVWKETAFKVFQDELKMKPAEMPGAEKVQSTIREVLDALQKEFGEVTYQQFLDDDDIIDATDDLLNDKIENAGTTKDRQIAEALKVAAAQLPPLRP
jgi:hypothetical protein